MGATAGLGGAHAMTPDVRALCFRGEAAFANDEFEEAEAWYELACRGGYRDPRFGANSPAGRVYGAELVRNRFARWEQLRAMMYQRSVRRLAKPDPGHVFAVMKVYGQDNRGKVTNAVHDRGGLVVLDGCGEPVQGQAQTFFHALRWAASRQDFTALTLLEDDIVLAKNALDYIATTKIDDDLGFISWFSIYHHDGPRVPPLLHCIPARDYQFNQAITFPVRTVHELLASDALKNWSEPHGADRIYKDVFPDRKVAIHYPNLVQHVGGQNSLVGNDAHGRRESLSFIGEDFDALSMVR
jgi:hypothetical protein